ncbi:MnmC family methyltransferase, partial [Rhizobium ruizarguesonis]
ATLGRALSHWPALDAERAALTATWPQTPTDTISLDLAGQTTLSVVCGHALDGVAAAQPGFDAWYLDGFAPSRNSDMRAEQLMRFAGEKSAAGGAFATYAAAGFVRR